MSLEEENNSKPGRNFLIALGAIGLILGGLVGAELAVPLQPQLGGEATSGGPGTVVMPIGVGTNLQLNFAPSVITVIVGVNGTVTFVNDDTAIHTVTALDHSFSSGDMSKGETFTHTFTSPGTYDYVCIYHSFWMKGQVVVKAS